MRKTLLSAFLLLAPLAMSQTVTEHGQSARDAARELAGAIRSSDMSWMVDRMYPPIQRVYADRLGARSARGEVESSQRYLGSRRESDAEAIARMERNMRNLRTSYMKMGAAMKQQGVRIENYLVGEPFSEYVVTPPKNTVTGVLRDKQGQCSAENLTMGQDRSRLVVLPTTIIASVPNPRGGKLRIEQKSFLYAVRDEVISSTKNWRGARLNAWYFIDAKTDVGILRSFFPDLPRDLQLPPVSNRQLH